MAEKKTHLKYQIEETIWNYINNIYIVFINSELQKHDLTYGFGKILYSWDFSVYQIEVSGNILV